MGPDFKVLVTGGAGYIGSHTVLALLGQCEVTILDNLSRGHRQLVPPGVDLVEADLRNREAVLALLLRRRFDAVLHFAAYAYVAESVERPGMYFENNVAGSQNLLDAMVASGTSRLVFSSTCAVYGNPERLPLTEEAPMAPVNPYGESKAAVERMLHWYGRAHQLRSVCLRYFNAAGADPAGRSGEWHEPEPHAIPRLLQAARGGNPFTIYGTDYDTPDGSAIRDYVHVSDLAAAHVLAMRHLAAGGGSMAINLGTGRGVSVLEMVAQAEGVLKRRIQTVARPRRSGDPPALVADAGLAQRVLGWAPALDLGIQIATAWTWAQRAKRAAVAAASG